MKIALVICLLSSFLPAHTANAQTLTPITPGARGLTPIQGPGGQTSLTADDLAVIATRVNPDRSAKNFGTVLRECTGNEVCNGAVDAALSYFNVPPGTAKKIVDFVPNVTQNGENTFYTMQLPQGYSFCHLKMDYYSINPPTGDRASFMIIHITGSQVEVNTWTPVQGLGEGRSWVDALITVQGVKNDVADQWYAAGKCQIARDVTLVCRGDFSKSQINNGQAGCQSVGF